MGMSDEMMWDEMMEDGDGGWGWMGGDSAASRLPADAAAVGGVRAAEVDTDGRCPEGGVRGVEVDTDGRCPDGGVRAVGVDTDGRCPDWSNSRVRTAVAFFKFGPSYTTITDSTFASRIPTLTSTRP